MQLGTCDSLQKKKRLSKLMKKWLILYTSAKTEKSFPSYMLVQCKLQASFGDLCQIKKTFYALLCYRRVAKVVLCQRTKHGDKGVALCYPFLNK